ncbi:MAG: translation elongation factor Ts [Candidatus Omnitrophica bacterium]|nr:translation elongation factor Ts [Candidatus Omnitrophota bacterium]
MSTMDAIKDLREKTSCGMMECKEALKEAAGDIEKAIVILRKKGAAKAEKKSTRTANQGIVESYIHMGSKIGVLVEINCETDFVAKNEDFQQFAKDVAMQIAAAHPKYVRPDEVPCEDIEKEKEIGRSQIKGKPDNVVEKILEGKISKYYEDVCLLNQAYIKDPSLKIKDLLTNLIGKIGENIVIKRFSRFDVGAE